MKWVYVIKIVLSKIFDSNKFSKKNFNFKENTMKQLLILLVITIFAVGCNSKSTPTSSALAKVNNTVITKEIFFERINRLPEWARGRFQSKEGKKDFLEEIIKEELLYQEAIQLGLHNEKEFQDKVEEFRKMSLITTLLKKEIEEKAVTDPKEIKNFYEKHQDNFKSNLEVKAKHILVETKEEADDIIEKLQKKEDFSDLAKQFSKDTGSAKNGGDLGFFGKGMMVPEFEHAAFNLKPGETSVPVKTQFGYHIIQVTDRKEGTMRDFEEVKTTIEKQLTVEKQRNLFESYIKKLKEKTGKVKIYDEALTTLTLENAPK